MHETTTLDALARALDRLTQENAQLRQENESLRLALDLVGQVCRDLPDEIGEVAERVRLESLRAVLTDREANILEAVGVKPMQAERIARVAGYTASASSVRAVLGWLSRFGLVHHIEKDGYWKSRSG